MCSCAYAHACVVESKGAKHRKRTSNAPLPTAAVNMESSSERGELQWRQAAGSRTLQANVKRTCALHLPVLPLQLTPRYWDVYFIGPPRLCVGTSPPLLHSGPNVLFKQVRGPGSRCCSFTPPHDDAIFHTQKGNQIKRSDLKKASKGSGFKIRGGRPYHQGDLTGEAIQQRRETAESCMLHEHAA
jgi:hypothetical protein